MLDKTNRCVRLCRRIEEVELILSLQEGRTQTELDELWDELQALETELSDLQPATT